MLTEAVNVEGAVPDACVTVNHEALSVCDQFNVPLPVFVMLMVWFAGFDPPAVAVKLRLLGLTPMVGLVATLPLAL